MSIFIKNMFKIIALLILVSQPALAQLSVSPKRVIFEGRERSQELLLLNTGDTTKKYRIHFKQLKMTEQGGYVTIDDDATAQHLLASQAVRFSPRQVTLTPGMAQTVRLLVRKPKGFVSGEYRSHLTFSEIPDDNIEQTLAPNDDTIAADQGFAFQMRPLLGMSMPIIIRHGKLSQAAQMKLPMLNDKQIELQLHRNGEASVYGLITAIFTPKDGSEPIEIGRVKGVSVLTPLKWRSVQVPLSHQIDALGHGELHIRYRNLEQLSAKTQPLLAELSLTL